MINTSPGMQMSAVPIQTKAFKPKRCDLQRMAIAAPTARLSPIMKVLLKISASDAVIVTPRRTGQSRIIATQRTNKPLRSKRR